MRVGGVPQHEWRYWLKLGVSLLLVSLLLVIGSQLAFRQRLVRSEVQNVPPLLLSEVKEPQALKEALRSLFPPGDDLSLAAEGLSAYLLKDEGPTRLSAVSQLKNAQFSAEMLKQYPNAQEYSLLVEKTKRDAKLKGEAARTEFPVLSSRQLNTLRPGVVVRSSDQVARQLRASTLLALLGLWLPVLVWFFRRLRPDPWILPLASALSGLGFTMMVTLRDPLRESLLFPDFAIGILGGGILLAVVSLYDLQASPLRHLSFVPLLAALLTSLVLLTVGVGPGGSDAKVNLHLGPVVLQPVELIKIFVVLFLAGYCARRWEFLRSLIMGARPVGAGDDSAPGHLETALRRMALPRPQDLFPLVVGVLLSLAFLFLQKDMGPALVLGVTFLALYSVARNRGGLALVGLLILVAGCYAGYLLHTPNTVYRRIEMLLNPWSTLRPGADQLAQGLWAVAAGGVNGAGLGWGETARVPAAHTDFILAAVAEELGFFGLLLVFTLYGLLFWRFLRVARRMVDPYAFFLVLGFATLLMGQLALIGAGVMGIFPLSGVTSPLLSYGKSSQWSVFLIVGAVAALSAHARMHAHAVAGGAPVAGDEPPPSAEAAPFMSGLKVLTAIGLGLMLVLTARAADLQIRQADALMVQPLLAMQAGNEVAFVPNPRLRAIADRIERGTISDRNGLPLATSRRGEADAYHESISSLGVDPDSNCSDLTRRCYPFGPLTFHLLGDLRETVNWAASNVSFAEKEENALLQGFDDNPKLVEVAMPDGSTSREQKRDYSALLPVWWVHQDPAAPAFKALMEKPRNLQLTVDMKMQVALTNAVDHALQAARQDLIKTGTPSDSASDVVRAAAVVLDAETGAVLASVTAPRPLRLGSALRLYSPDAEELFDRPRFGVYTPGSTFKLVTAMAALRKDPSLAEKPFQCRLLPGENRAGTILPGQSRPIRDDAKDHPHGNVSMRYGIQVSCNAYFSQLATLEVKAEALHNTAELFDISTSRPNTVKRLEQVIHQVGFGQGEVVASPLQIATVAATVANGGRFVKPIYTLEQEVRTRGLVTGRADAEVRSGELQVGDRILTEGQATLLADAMRDVVTAGTARRALGTLPLHVAGKTGTAEVQGKRSHAWFMGFARRDESNPESKLERPIAFAVLVENVGYGGKYAAPIIGEMLTTLYAPPVEESKAETTSTGATTAKAVTPKAVTPKAVTPKAETPKAVAPKAGTPRTATPRTVTPRATQPKTTSTPTRSSSTSSKNTSGRAR